VGPSAVPALELDTRPITALRHPEKGWGAVSGTCSPHARLGRCLPHVEPPVLTHATTFTSLCAHQALSFGSEPYRVLGLKHGADEAEIKHAFRRLALRYHPDVAGEHTRAHFELIRSAYDLLRRHGKQAVEDSHQLQGVEDSGPPVDPAARVRSQLDGLRSRAAQRERKHAEQMQRAAMRAHHTRGQMSGRASSEAARERLQEQIASLFQRTGRTDGTDELPSSAHHMQALLPGPGLGHAVRAQDTAALPSHHKIAQEEEVEDIRKLVRLARLARFWRDHTPGFPVEMHLNAQAPASQMQGGEP
jgi:curved DNA-binding protein CbpA